MAALVIVRSITAADRAAWEPLWAGYLAFYQASLPPTVTDSTWARILDPNEPVHALIAQSDDRLRGVVHYVLHRSTWAAQCYCYLEDLFVSPDARGRGVGRALIDAVEAKANAAGASRLYWNTHETNAQAQVLYDQLAERSGFIQYRKKLI